MVHCFTVRMNEGAQVAKQGFSACIKRKTIRKYYEEILS